MTEEEKINQKLEELSNALDELETVLDDLIDEDDDFIDDEDNEDDEDITCEELDGDGVGYGISFNLDKLLDPRYNEHILSEPDENGMVEISDELYDRLYGKYHSKEDMLSDIISELEYYVSGKLAGDPECWSDTRYLAIDKKSNRPRVGTKEEILEMVNNEDKEFDIYDIDEFEQCFWTDDTDFYEWGLEDDTAIRKLIDKYYPDLDW